MKYQQSEINIKTSCEECAFSIVEDGVQTGCATGRLSKFKYRQEVIEENGKYHIKRVCNHHNKNTDIPVSQNVEKVKDKVKVKIGIVLVVEDADLLSKTIDSIKNIDYSKNKFFTVIQVQAQRDNISKFVGISNDLKNNEILNKVVFNFNNIQTLKDYDSFKFISHAHYFLYIKSGDILDSKLFEKVNNLINEDLEQILMFEDNNNNLLLSSNLVKSKYLEFNDYKIMEQQLKSKLKDSTFFRKIT